MVKTLTIRFLCVVGKNNSLSLQNKLYTHNLELNKLTRVCRLIKKKLFVTLTADAMARRSVPLNLFFHLIKSLFKYLLATSVSEVQK
jgi:hypothetical protein